MPRRNTPKRISLIPVGKNANSYETKEEKSEGNVSERAVQDIQNSAKMKYASLKQTSKEKMVERVDEMRRMKTAAAATTTTTTHQSRQQRAPPTGMSAD